MSGQNNYPPPFFGKYQPFFSFLQFQFIYFTLYFTVLHIIYALLTLQPTVLAFYLVVSLAQAKVGRSQRYVDFVNRYLQPNRCLKEVKTIYEEPITAPNKCLYGFHPHSVFPPSTMMLMNAPGQGPISSVKTLASRELFHVPFTGLLLRLWGANAVDAHHMKRLMAKDENIGLVPGGFEEATLTVPDQLRLFLKERKGFIKYALQFNYTIYPVLFLNQHKMFWTFPYFMKFRIWLNKFKIPSVFYFNPKFLWFMSTDISYTTVIGRGIKGRHFQPNEEPSHQQIDEMHAKYMAEITRMHQKYKEISGVPLKFY